MQIRLESCSRSGKLICDAQLIRTREQRAPNVLSPQRPPRGACRRRILRPHINSIGRRRWRYDFAPRVLQPTIKKKLRINFTLSQRQLVWNVHERRIGQENSGNSLMKMGQSEALCIICLRDSDITQPVIGCVRVLFRNNCDRKVWKSHMANYHLAASTHLVILYAHRKLVTLT